MFKGLRFIELSVVLAILIAGFASLAFGVYADTIGFWDQRAFLTNIISGFSGACFGIPFAFLILRQMADNRIKRVQNEALRGLSRQAATVFRQAIEGYSFVSGRPAERALSEALESQRAAMELKKESPTNSAQARLQSATDELEGRLAELPARVQFEEQWARMEEAWRFIRDVVKPRYYENDLSWISLDDEVIINRVLGRNEHAFSNFEGLADRTAMFQYNGLDVSGHFDAVDRALNQCSEMERFRNASYHVLETVEYNWWLR